MTQVLSDSQWASQISKCLEGLFALSALVLAAVGLHGLVSPAVAWRCGVSRRS
jgi:hypothetical protein